MKSLVSLNVDKVASAVEKDAGRALPGLRTSLEQAKAGQVTTVRKGDRPVLMETVTRRP